MGTSFTFFFLMVVGGAWCHCSLPTDVHRRKRMNGWIEIDQDLFEAADGNNLPEARRLLSVGADVNASREADEKTPLIVACYNGHVQLVKELLKHGADIEAEDINGRTPLHWACSNGHLAVVNELRSPGAEIHAIDSNGTTTTLGKRKTRAGAEIEAKDSRGNTPLILASFKGHLAVVMALLAVGADILAVNNYGLLPIHRAIDEGNSAVAKCLLEQFYATAFHLPLHVLMEDLTWSGDRISCDAPTLRAALYHDVLGTDDVVEILEFLVDQNPALLYSRDQDGLLPLHVACRRGASFAIVQFLVNRYKASVKIVTSEGDLPLFLACEMPEPSLDTIFLLLKLYPDLVYR
jgi:ankyrin repeat protein